MLGKIVLTERGIARRVGELASEVAAELPDRRPLLVGLLTGSYVFVADLARALSREGVEPEVHFMQTSHYRGGTVADGRVVIERDLEPDPAGRSVLVADDILDSGCSLHLVRGTLAARNPGWLRSCVLLSKRCERRVDIEADHVGFEIPDLWVVGYGLDLDGRYRELPHVVEARPRTEE